MKTLLTVLAAVALLAPSLVVAETTVGLEPSTGGYFDGLRMDCPGTLKFSQAPVNWPNGGSSQDEEIDGCPGALVSELADDFPGGNDPITAVRFWGITNGSYFDCSASNSFRITIHAPGNTPGDVLCNYSGIPAVCDFVPGFPGLTSMEHCAELPEPCAQTDGGWIVVQAQYCRGNTGGDGQYWWGMEPNSNGSQVYFRSAFFGFPNWTAGNTVFGDFFDADFELYTDGGGTPTVESSWTGLKSLYR